MGDNFNFDCNNKFYHVHICVESKKELVIRHTFIINLYFYFFFTFEHITSITTVNDIKYNFQINKTT